MATRCLSFHAEYRCRHSGACCTSLWPIPVEADRLGTLRAALENGQLRTVDAGPALIELDVTEHGAPALVAARSGTCVFFDDRGGRLCRIHAALGHAALPLACRQFPRVSVTDPRGASVTLSHYCPTALSMLTGQAPVAITRASTFPADAEYVGLDATTSLPPLLRPGVLMDWDAWWEWERLAVLYLGQAMGPIDRTLSTLSAAVEDVRAWTPGDGDLTGRVRRAFADPTPARSRRGPRAASLVGEIVEAIPEDIRPASPTGHAVPGDDVLHRYVAAHAFANWTAHLGQGLRSWFRSLEGVVALVESGCGIRHADLLVRHLADPNHLAAAWSRAETGMDDLAI